jgi:hypothetical protein
MGKFVLLSFFGILTLFCGTFALPAFQYYPTPVVNNTRKMASSDDDDNNNNNGEILQGISFTRRGCVSHFLPTTMSTNITHKCVNLIGFKMENFPPTEEDLIKINYEDKVF